ncbi:MAG: hypothetical protein LBK60_12580 [Verrucomicrobiales bacterium]|jgi:hypothetical protein|nr:hypothetical protein [Verrucomicrobiales bacterium]
MKLDYVKKYLPVGSFGISLLLHLAIFIGISGIVLIQSVPSKQFFSTEPGGPTSDLPPPPEIPDENIDPDPSGDPADAAEEVQPARSAVPVEQITSSVATNVTFTLPPQIGTVTGAADGIGKGGVPGGKGSGGRGGPPRALANPFGDRNISGDDALVGTMYDLKQTANRKPSKFAPDTAREEYLAFVKRLASSWNRALLEPYYKVEQPIGTYQIFIPKIFATAAPAAFKAEKYVAPKRWVILYTGNFTSPASGTYRFVALADDVLVVRLNGRVVADGSLFPATSCRREILGKPYIIDHPQFQMYAGEWFQLEKGKQYPLEILLGENPGGDFAAYLQIQEKGVEYPQRKGFGPALPVFQTRPCAIPRGIIPPIAPKPFVNE